MSKGKLILVSLVIIIGVVVAGYYILNSRTGTTTDIQIDARKFLGSVVAINDQTITLRGIFGDPQGTAFESTPTEREFSFQVNESTSFEKVEIYLPDWEKLPEEGGVIEKSFSLEDLPKNEGAGSLADLQRSSLLYPSLSVEADFTHSISNSENPVASRVFYHILVEPPQTP